MLLLGLAASGAVAREADDRQTRVFSLGAGAALSLEATNAAVRLVGAARRDAHLDVLRRAPTSEGLRRFPLVVREDARGVHVSVTQMDGATDAALRAEITLTVPERTVVSSLEIGEGRLEIRDFHGRLTADVRQGPISGRDVSGVLRLETGIGSLDLQRARLSPGGLLRLRAFNGDITLAFAERPAHARVMALALNGTIRSTIPLTTKTAWGPRWGEATLGRGDRVVSLDVVTGQIRIETPR